ncbi:MAG: isoleucine--tRNA ligase [Candidatus Levybacteria bacterium]|nr:isoleucine--tRNA ligase [Candidatus Levybacteria bacterium]
MFKPVSSQIDFPKLEEELLARWQQKGIVDKYLHKNTSSKQKFSFLDGPITANNPMAVHHAWGRTYKDLWQRFWNMKGRKQRFQNGFDEQGLWVEVEVEKELSLRNKKDIENLVSGNKFESIEKFINLCKERVKKFSAIQTEQSKRLGYFMDWDNSYHTSSDENNYAIWNFIKVVNEKGWLYKGHDTVPWCPRCGTAISQHEILTEEYKEITHETVYFKLPIKNKANEYLLVWTTTPWTIPSNVAIAVNPKEQYVLTKSSNGEKLWLMEKRWLIKEKKDEIFAKKLGKELIGWEYVAPFDEIPLVKKTLGNYVHRIIDGGDIVTETEGTGLLHVAPGAGEEDFKLGKENNLPVIASIEEDASYVAGMGEFAGKNAKKHPELIIDYLKSYEDGKYFFETERITHRYPTCWRCKTELVWRVVDEWYIAMDKKDKSGRTYREQMAEVVKKINWIPSWGKERELDWLKNMHDWLISKKRYWGLALPIWECIKRKHFEVIGGKNELREKAVKGWDIFDGNSPHRPWIDEVKLKCEKCGEIMQRVPDVGNPWLDAGIVPFSTLPEDWFPADFITESFPGQFKNWFYSLIAMSTALKNTNPFATVLGFASVRDEKGEEMHKSKGNAVEFNEGAQNLGSDVMRWMFATANPENNLNFGYKAASETKRKFYLILWNSYKFFVDYVNFSKWNPNTKVGTLKPLDLWILAKLNQVIDVTNKSLEKYDAMISSRAIQDFVINDFSTWYVRRSRNRVGTTSDSNERNIALSTMYKVLLTLCKLLAPFVPFISDEMFINLTGEESVHLQNYPLKDESLLDKKLIDDMSFVRTIVELGHAKRKELDIKVRQPLAKFSIFNSKFSIDEELIDLIKDELNVKKVVFEKNKGELFVEFDTNITKDLQEEMEARDIIRQIQEERKRLETELNDNINVTLPDWPLPFEGLIKKKTLIRNLKKGPKFIVDRV